MKCGPNKNDKYCAVNCKKDSPKWIEDIKNCNEWHQCNGTQVIKSSSCPKGQIFIQDEQSCIYDNNECYRKFNICDIAKTDEPFWDEFNCHKYFVCNSKGDMKAVKCQNTTDYYDVRSGKCIAKAKVDCYKHPVPLEVCGNQKFAIRNRFVNDQATCRGYFYCRDLGIDRYDSLSYNYKPDKEPYWGQCEMGEFFDEETQSCRNQNYIKCEEDRCDSRKSGKILSTIKGCQHYLVCENGYSAKELKCEDNKYFDPNIEECVYRKISYPICE
ncbi:peritrophin-48 [Cochliomyia hominivorax]